MCAQVLHSSLRAVTAGGKRQRTGIKYKVRPHPSTPARLRRQPAGCRAQCHYRGAGCTATG